MQVTSGKVYGAQKTVLYGPEGIGKSTLAAQFPRALFIDTEGSTKFLDVKRLPTPTSWSMLMEEISWAISNTSEMSTLVIDTADWAERLCIEHVCAKLKIAGIEDAGYGKGYTYLAEEFGRLLDRLTDLTAKGVNVVLTAHAAIVKFEQPDELAPYDRWELKLQRKKVAPLVKEWADMLLFANYKTYAVKNDKTGNVKAQGGKRIIYTSHNPAWDAKNRCGFPDEMPMEWASLEEAIVGSAIRGSSDSPEPVLTPAPAHKNDVTACVVERRPEKQEAGAAITEPPKTPVDTVVPPDTGGWDLGIDPSALPPYFAPLLDLMREARVTEEDVRWASADRRYFTYERPFSTYPREYIEGSLVAAWPSLLALIRERPKEGIPF